jgi:hypothetical protein
VSLSFLFVHTVNTWFRIYDRYSIVKEH